MGTEEHIDARLMALSIEQQNAIGLLITGLTDREVAERVGVRRETVTKWRLYHPAFRAELNRIRKGLWEQGVDRLRNLVPDAVSVLEEVIHDINNPHRWRIALDVVRLAKVPDRFPESHGPDTPQGIIREEAERRKSRSMFESLVPEPDEADFLEVAKELEENLR